MYNPSAFLITTGALTSIFNFFFGEYYRERERVYRLWLRVFAYDAAQTISCVEEICSVMESKERMFRQAKAFLVILIISLLGCFAVFQLYSAQYIDPTSPAFEIDARHTWLTYSAIMGLLVLINLAEMLYIRLAFSVRWKFPFIRVRPRVTGQARLSMLWQVLDCPHRKRQEFGKNRIPEMFYKDLDDPKSAFEDCFLGGEMRDLSTDCFPGHATRDGRESCPAPKETNAGEKDDD